MTLLTWIVIVTIVLLVFFYRNRLDRKMKSRFDDFSRVFLVPAGYERLPTDLELEERISSLANSLFSRGLLTRVDSVFRKDFGPQKSVCIFEGVYRHRSGSYYAPFVGLLLRVQDHDPSGTRPITRGTEWLNPMVMSWKALLVALVIVSFVGFFLSRELIPKQFAELQLYFEQIFLVGPALIAVAIYLVSNRLPNFFSRRVKERLQEASARQAALLEKVERFSEANILRMVGFTLDQNVFQILLSVDLGSRDFQVDVERKLTGVHQVLTSLVDST